jgi:hypothetical protein
MVAKEEFADLKLPQGLAKEKRGGGGRVSIVAAPARSPSPWGCGNLYPAIRLS